MDKYDVLQVTTTFHRLKCEDIMCFRYSVFLLYMYDTNNVSIFIGSYSVTKSFHIRQKFAYIYIKLYLTYMNWLLLKLVSFKILHYILTGNKYLLEKRGFLCWRENIKVIGYKYINEKRRTFTIYYSNNQVKVFFTKRYKNMTISSIPFC